jgi:CRP/FNR family transcriptional regulator, cyclic AMP receptor protein
LRWLSLTCDVLAFLAKAGLNRRIIQLKPKQAFDPVDSIFCLQSGHAKLSIVSEKDKETTVTLFAVGDSVGEESLATVGGLRLATATAITSLAIPRSERQ